MTLTLDQRWLLCHMGGWEIVAALCSPDGVDRLMRSCWGSTGGRSHATEVPGCPEWVRSCGWDIAGGTITGHTRGGLEVKVTGRAINRFADQLDDDTRAELIACNSASQANANLGYRMCRNTREHTHLPYETDRICPATDEQLDAHNAEHWRVVDWQKQLLPAALGLVGSRSGRRTVGEQLEMFG